MSRRKFAVGDIVQVRGRDYGYFKVHQLLPKGAHGRTCMLAEVLHSLDLNFSFAYIRTFRVADLKHAKEETP